MLRDISCNGANLHFAGESVSISIAAAAADLHQQTNEKNNDKKTLIATSLAGQLTATEKALRVEYTMRIFISREY